MQTPHIESSNLAFIVFAYGFEFQNILSSNMKGISLYHEKKN